MQIRKPEKINIVAGEKECPGDELMKLYRQHAKELKKNLVYTKSSIDFFKSMCDVFEHSGRNLTFFWEAMVEEDMPALKIKVQKTGKNYKLLYLKEKVNFEERQNEFKGRITLNINQSQLGKRAKKGTTIINKEIERE